jgi:hypothetical protein
MALFRGDMAAYPVNIDEASLSEPLYPRGFRSEIFRAAKLIIHQHREEAVMFAARRADQLLEEGDLDDSAVWRRILAATEELQRGRREDEVVN